MKKFWEIAGKIAIGIIILPAFTVYINIHWVIILGIWYLL
jgi:hypothetical protein